MEKETRSAEEALAVSPEDTAAQRAADREFAAEREKARKRRRAAAAVALATSASVVVGGLFQSPAALLDDSNPVPAVAWTESEDPGSEDDGDSSAETQVQLQNEEESGVRAVVRQRILQLPYAVRLLVVLPLWCLGWLILTGATALWSAVLTPVLGKVLGWVCLLGALLGAFLLAAKTIFPDLPIRKILNKRSVLGLVIGAVVLALADICIPLFWADYTRIESIVRAGGILLVLGTVTLSFARRERKRRRGRAEATPEMPVPSGVSRRQVLAMADSVSRPRGGGKESTS